MLGLCAQAGLATVGVIAIDGTKVHANASRDANLDYEQIAREILEEAKAVDAAEDERFGEARGDELPPELATSAGPARVGCAKPSVASIEQRAAGGPADPALAARSASRRPSAASTRSSFNECRANAAYEAYRARGRDEGRPALRPDRRSPTSRRRFRRARST